MPESTNAEKAHSPRWVQRPLWHWLCWAYARLGFSVDCTHNGRDADA
jgi:hypothetical protein